jgi:hypothetical protein
MIAMITKASGSRRMKKMVRHKLVEKRDEADA